MVDLAIHYRALFLPERAGKAMLRPQEIATAPTNRAAGGKR